MTNGENILSAFSNATIKVCKNKDFTYIEVEQNDKWIADFDMEWWNAEYKEPTTKNDIALIHTEGLDEEIRCTMCTNSMKSDRGCDGSCVVNNAMYKEVMDVIENHIVDTGKKIESTTEREKINKSAMMYEIYMAGVNMAGEYRGCWVRFKDIEKIIDKYVR